MNREKADGRTRVTVLVALAANLLIATAKIIGGIVSGSPALLSEAAHSVADSTNEVLLLIAVRRSRRAADRDHPFGAGDPALRTVIAEDSTAVCGVLLAAAGMSLHLATGEAVWEAAASLAIGLLLVYVAYRLGREARGRLIGEAVDPVLWDRIHGLLDEQPEIDNVAELLTMRLGLDSTLVAARVDLAPGLDSEEVELVSVRIKRLIRTEWPKAHHVFLDITEAPTPDTP